MNSSKRLTEKLDLANIIKDNSENSDAKLQLWLQAKNAYYMRKICEGYYRGSFFYDEDTKHFANCDQGLRKPTPLNSTTLSSLKPIVYLNIYSKSKLHIGKSYMIADNDECPSETLFQLPFAVTALECGASVQLPFYFTLMDILITHYGYDKGREVFDRVFAAKPLDIHNLNRFRIGSMGINFNPDWYDFSPIYYFNNWNGAITLQDLVTKPSQYIGMKFSIGGHKEYLLKHPERASQAWNVIFKGIDNKNNPLFYAARGVGENYVLSYNEIINLLNNEYNRMPDIANKKLAGSQSSKDQMIGLYDYSINFSIEHVKLLLCDVDRCLNEIKNGCDAVYLDQIRGNGHVTVSTSIKTTLFRSKDIIKKVKDDINVRSCHFFKPKADSSRMNLIIQDDSQLKVSYRRC